MKGYELIARFYGWKKASTEDGGLLIFHDKLGLYVRSWKEAAKHDY